MPETYILYRFFFEDFGYTAKWWYEFNNFGSNDRTKIIKIIKKNEFKELDKSELSPSILDFIQEHYLVSREDIKNPKSKYYKEKQEYDALKIHCKSKTHLQLTRNDMQSGITKEYSSPTLLGKEKIKAEQSVSLIGQQVLQLQPKCSNHS